MRHTDSERIIRTLLVTTKNQFALTRQEEVINDGGHLLCIDLTTSQDGTHASQTTRTLPKRKPVKGEVGHFSLIRYTSQHLTPSVGGHGQRNNMRQPTSLWQFRFFLQPSVKEELAVLVRSRKRPLKQQTPLPCLRRRYGYE